MATKTHQIVADFPAQHQMRSACIVRDDFKPQDMRFEVVYQTGDRSNPVSWRFFSTKRDALEFVRSIR